MKATCKSRILGISFGILGLLIGGGMLLEFDFPKMLSTGFTTVEGLSITIPFIITSAFFGRWTGTKILKHPKLAPVYGIFSSLLTTWLTCFMYVFYLLFTEESDASAFFESIFILLFYSSMLGGIPIVVIGAIFGWVLQFTLKEKKS